MSNRRKGTLIIIGGHEDKQGDQAILNEICEKAKGPKKRLALVTVATIEPEAMAEDYTKVFRELGVENIDVIDIRARADAEQEENVRKVCNANVVFFTGGDQLRITSQVGDSPVFQCLHDLFQHGGVIAGTSAGAAAMPETMLISGPSDESNEVSALGMAPGLALIHGVVIDTHFAERGRMGRLLGAVAQNPRNIGLGIDEDTAVVVEKENHFRVLGSGAVYVVDGMDISYSSLSERHPEGIVTLHNVKVHVLGDGDCYDLQRRCPIMPEEELRRAS